MALLVPDEEPMSQEVSGTRSTDPQPPNERLAALEVTSTARGVELQRVRDRLHKAEGELAAVQYLGKQIETMARSIEELADNVGALSRRAIERPTAAGWSAVAGWGSLLVALAALALVVFRG